MLNKLLKYDLKSVYKVVIIFYVLAIFFATAGRLFGLADNSFILEIVSSVSMGFAVGMCISSLINNLMRCWVRFSSNLYGDESYLTHTLPVSKKNVYLSKVLTAVISMFTTVLVIIISIAIMYYSKSNIDALKTMLEMTAGTYNSTVLKLLLVITLCFFVEMFFIIVVGYFGIILGHKSNNNKTIKSIVIGFISYIVSQLFIILFIYICGLFNSDVMNLFTSSTIGDTNVIKSILILCMFIYVIFISGFYMVSVKLLKNGVNVD